MDETHYLLFTPYKHNQLIVGYLDECGPGTGLTDPTIKDVIIPPQYRGKYVTAIGYKAFCYTSIEFIFIPFTIRFISRSALNGCLKLNKIIFQQSNQPIEFGLYVFGNITINELVLPSSATVIPSDRFFHAMPNVEKIVYCGSNAFPIDNQTFLNSNNNVKIIVSKNYPKSTDFFGKSVNIDNSICEPILESTYYFFYCTLKSGFNSVQIPFLIISLFFFLS